MLRQADAQSTYFCMTKVPSHCRCVHSERDVPAPASGRSLPLCKWTPDTQNAPHLQINMKANLQAMHTISVVLIVTGSCREVRSQEAEKRNQSFVGLINSEEL